MFKIFLINFLQNLCKFENLSKNDQKNALFPWKNRNSWFLGNRQTKITKNYENQKEMLEAIIFVVLSLKFLQNSKSYLILNLGSFWAQKFPNVTQNFPIPLKTSLLGKKQKIDRLMFPPKISNDFQKISFFSQKNGFFDTYLLVIYFRFLVHTACWRE